MKEYKDMRSNWEFGEASQCRKGLMCGMGYTPEEQQRPLIGVVNSWNEYNPGHVHLDKLAERVKQGIREAGGLPLGNDSYVIGAEDSQFSADEQFLLLVSHPSAYEDKTFVIYGTVGEDEELGVSVINAGDYGTFYYYCSDGVSKPAYGDTVKITATFINTADKGYNSDYYCYTMLVSECEVLAHGMGPNGGRIMFITASSLNVRTSSDTSSSDNILGTLSYGDTVEVFEQDEKGWWRIEFNGQTAYISNKYVSETRPE